MSGRINLAELRDFAPEIKGTLTGDTVGVSRSDLLALVEAVEAAENLRRRQGMGTANALAWLEEALARFDFGEAQP